VWFQVPAKAVTWGEYSLVVCGHSLIVASGFEKGTLVSLLLHSCSQVFDKGSQVKQGTHRFPALVSKSVNQVSKRVKVQQGGHFKSLKYQVVRSYARCSHTS
jgi:hypothetical protein